MTNFEQNILCDLILMWRGDAVSGFMPDEEGNKIAATRTKACADQLSDVINALAVLRTTLRREKEKP